jgi:osmotically-inducible protein OsmY
MAGMIAQVRINNMNTHTTLGRAALLLIATLPAALFASQASDQQIVDAAKASYNFHTVLGDRVVAQSNDGVVTLTGNVQDSDEKALAVDTATNISGVSGVRDEILIKPDFTEHSDAWIAWKIRARLLVEANVSATATKIDVKDGVVTLSGNAENAAQKDLTEAYAKDISNVRSVDNEMIVEAPAAGGTTMGDVVDDASITTQVKYALLTHGSTSALKTKVSTVDGVVSISGEANSDAEISLVSKLAQDIRGVKSVSNEMTVKG